MDGKSATCVRCGSVIEAGVRVCACGQPVPGSPPAPVPLAEAEARTQAKGISGPTESAVAFEEPPQTGSADDPRFKDGQTILGHYTVVRQLGKGGMGTVYLARDEVSGQEVAVKVLPASLARERDIRDRFIQEARALASMDHPNIVPLVTFSQEGEDRFLVMKYLQGEPLDARLRRLGVLPPEEARVVTRAVLSALGYAHARGVIHRDVKPSNVIIEGALDGENRVFLVDFGIAKKEEDGRHLTQTGMLMGTPQYMSPEQISGHPVDGRSDLYAAGLVLFEMLAGRPPFDGQKTFQVLRAHVEQPVPDVKELRGSPIPDDIEAICYVLLRKDPNERPRNAAEAIALLDGTMALPAALPTGRHMRPTPPTAAIPVARVAGHGGAPATAMVRGLGPMDTPDTARHLSEATEDSLDDPSVDEIAAVSSRRNPLLFAAALVVAAVAVGGLAFAKPFAHGTDARTAAAVDAGDEQRDHGVDKAAFLLLVQRARGALKDKSYKEASYAIEAAVGEQPEDASARSVQVDVRIAAGQLDDAERALADLKRLLARDPTPDPVVTAHIPEQEAALAAKRALSAETTPKPPIKHDEPRVPVVKHTSASSSSSTVSDAAIKAAANGTRNAVGDCYTNKVLAKDPKAGGVVTFNVRIKPSGRVESVELHGDGILASASFAACVATAIKGGWHFNTFKGDTTSVAYTVDLHP